MLIGGKKFDLRMYVLVTNYKPLRVWRCARGFARFCAEDYDNNAEELEGHLTNVALQKKSDKYNDIHGGKWTFSNLKFYLELNYGKKKLKKLLDEMDNIYLTSLKSCQVTKN